MGHLKPRRGPRQMSTATRPHGPRGKRNPDDTAEQLDDILDDVQAFMEDVAEFMDENKELLDSLDDTVWTYGICPYMVATEDDDSKCYCSARAREHCKRSVK